MRITKKDLLTLEYNKYNSEDYYIENDEEDVLDYDTYWSNEELQITISSLDDIVESYFIVSGSSGTWQGDKEIKEGYVYSVNYILNRMDTDNLSIYYDPEELAIVIRGVHHDGINMYYLRKPEWFNKRELINLGRSIDQYESKLKFNMLKNRLIEELQEILENYN